MPASKHRLADLATAHPVMVCRHVGDKSRDVLAMAIDEDQRVSLDCGDEEHGQEDWQMLTLAQVTAADQGLINAPAIGPEEYCERSFRGGPWWVAAFGAEGN